MSNIDATDPNLAPPAADAGLQPSALTVTPETADAGAQAPVSYSEQQYNELAQAAAALYADNQRFAKYRERVERFESDPEYAAFVDESTTFYEDGKKRKAPAEDAPAWFKPYAQAIDEFRGDRAQTVRARESEQQADLNKFYAEQRGYAARLKAEHKLSDSDIGELSAIADTLATQRNKRVGLEEAFRSVSRFGAGTLETPPPVLRGDAGIPGVPAPSSTNLKDSMKTADGRRATILSYIKSNS